MALVVIALTVSLGLWQTRRAEFKSGLLAAREQAARGPAPALTSVLRSDGRIAAEDEAGKQRLAQLPYGIPVAVNGRWLPEHTVFIDNRTHQGVSGFHVITPLAVQDSALVVAVNRGWIASDPRDRNRLPALRTPEGPVRLQAMVEQPVKALELGSGPGGAGPATGDNARPWQNFDAGRLSARLGKPVAPWLLRQTADAEAQDGLNRNWPVASDDVAKHRGYAFQWFGLTTLTALLWLWFVVIQPRRQRPAQSPTH